MTTTKDEGFSINIPMKFYKPKGSKTMLNNLIPEHSGVYFLWSKYELLYIGKTKNLKKRIAQHLSKSFLTQQQVNPDEIWKVSIIFSKDEFDALRLETNLINIIPTKFNKSPFFQSDIYWDWRNRTGIFNDRMWEHD